MNESRETPIWGNEIIVMDDLATHCMPEGIRLKRIYIRRDGEWAEMLRVFDCENHLISREKSESLCISGGKVKEISAKFVRRIGQTWVCDHVCPYKKRKIARLLNEHGDSIPEEAQAGMLEYLEKEYTVQKNGW